MDGFGNLSTVLSFPANAHYPQAGHANSRSGENGLDG